MNIIKIGLGLLLLLTISCNSDDGIDLRKDRVLVKEIVIADLHNKKNYKENTLIEYNKNAFVTKITAKVEYYDEQLLPNGQINRGIFKVNKTQTIHYKKDSLIDKIVIQTGSLQETKEFVYNDLNQIVTIEETNLNTHFKYNELGLVIEITTIDKRDSWTNSIEKITYDEEGNLLYLIHSIPPFEDYNYRFDIELYDLQHAFVNTNINLSFYDELRQTKGWKGISFSSPNLLSNFEYVYKGKKAIKKITHNDTYSPIYYDNYEVMEVNRNFISAYYRDAKWLPKVHVYYKFY